MTAPEWRAPPDTMREDVTRIQSSRRRMPDVDSFQETHEDGRADVVRWVRAMLGVECEWVRDTRPGPFELGNWMLLITGSEWVCALVRDLKIGRFRVVRVVPLPKGET